jgi:hypothetical protein
MDPALRTLFRSFPQRAPNGLRGVFDQGQVELVSQPLEPSMSAHWP